MMSQVQEQLLELLKERSFRRGQFKLASGDSSTYYIDGKTSEVYSAGAYLIGEAIYEVTSDLKFDAIGGLEVGAVPLTTAAVISYHHHKKSMEGFWVRDTVKDHGTKKLIEGYTKRGARLVIVDDVVTRGTSAVKAIKAVKEAGCEVVAVVTLVDRSVGAAALFLEEGVTDYRPIFTIKDFGVDERQQAQVVARR